MMHSRCKSRFENKFKYEKKTNENIPFIATKIKLMLTLTIQLFKII